MNATLNKTAYSFAIFGLLAGLGTAGAQTISVPEERAAFLERIESLAPVPATEAANRFDEASDPFYRDQPEEEEDETVSEEERVVTGPSDREILEGIAERIRPSATMIVGGERILLFGERRVRAGDALQVSYQNEPYRVTVSEINHRSFTLTYGDRQISKPVQ